MTCAATSNLIERRLKLSLGEKKKKKNTRVSTNPTDPAPDHTKFSILRFFFGSRNCHVGPRLQDNRFSFAAAVVDLPHVCVEIALLFLHWSFDNKFEDIIKSFLHLFAVQF